MTWNERKSEMSDAEKKTTGDRLWVACAFKQSPHRSSP
jgi:hypothetical protein